MRRKYTRPQVLPGAGYLVRMTQVRGFLLAAFGISWTIAGIGFLLGVRSVHHPLYVVVAALCMLGPALAAVVQHRFRDRAPWAALALHPRHVRWRALWWTVAIGLAFVPMFFAVTAVCGGLPGMEAFGEVSITRVHFLTALQELLAARGITGPPTGLNARMADLPAVAVLLVAQLGGLLGAFTVNLPFMLGEELGWRGYLYQRLERWCGLHRVLFTGAVWGVWHAPLIAMGHNYPGHPVLGIGMMMVFCTALALLFDWSRWRVGSVWGPCILHGLVNGTAGGAVLFAWGGHPLVGSIAGLSGALAALVLGAIVLACDREYRAVFRYGPVHD